MPMLKDPSVKYRPYTPLNLHDRTWPSKTITKPPIWLSTDLRDGNQALANPMSIQQKTQFFLQIVKCGLKEVEISYPAASETDFQFTRNLIEDGLIPDDVWIQVLTPARADLITRTFESLAGAKKAILHMYNACCPCFRDVVFRNSQDETVELAVTHTKLVRKLVDEYSAKYGTQFKYEYSPETFSQTEPDFAVRVCEEVKKAWGKAGLGDERIIFNLPATVEIATPNHYADQIELFGRNISEREKVVISLHPHNDRGTAVAAAELAMMAGADRYWGVGIDANIAASALRAVISAANNALGSDPVSPARAHVVESEADISAAVSESLSLELPRHLQTAFLKVVQLNTTSTDGAISLDGLISLFRKTYEYDQASQGPFTLREFALLNPDTHTRRFEGVVSVAGKDEKIIGEGNGPLSAFLAALHTRLGKNARTPETPGALLHGTIEIREFAQHSIGSGSEVKAASYVLLGMDAASNRRTAWGIGVDEDIAVSGLRAVLSALCGLYKETPKSS
ncbi:hypothetical protein FRC08_015056 [Ceratobasidium sp. 394]|nr:hypothetical protein FRC08_015056 [Ceratobasidium sp. 394]